MTEYPWNRENIPKPNAEHIAAVIRMVNGMQNAALAVDPPLSKAQVYGFMLSALMEAEKLGPENLRKFVAILIVDRMFGHKD